MREETNYKLTVKQDIEIDLLNYKLDKIKKHFGIKP